MKSKRPLGIIVLGIFFLQTLIVTAKPIRTKDIFEYWDPSVEYSLAWCWQYDDKKEALKICRKAAEQGNAEALLTIGMCYWAGFSSTGIREDKTEAIYWFRRSAEKGNVKAQLFLGECYAKGEGIKKKQKQSN